MKHTCHAYGCKVALAVEMQQTAIANGQGDPLEGLLPKESA